MLSELSSGLFVYRTWHTANKNSVDSNLTDSLLRCLRSAENFSTPEYSDMARDAIEQIDLTLRLIASYPKVFELIKEPDDVKRVYSEGKIACSIGIEG